MYVAALAILVSCALSVCLIPLLRATSDVSCFPRADDRALNSLNGGCFSAWGGKINTTSLNDTGDESIIPSVRMVAHWTPEDPSFKVDFMEDFMIEWETGLALEAQQVCDTRHCCLCSAAV